MLGRQVQVTLVCSWTACGPAVWPKWVAAKTRQCWVGAAGPGRSRVSRAWNETAIEKFLDLAFVLKVPPRPMDSVT